MIVAVIGCSSPSSGAAVFLDDELLAGGFDEAPNRASGAALGILVASLESAGVEMDAVDVWAADVGPGSFTGAKVGVTLAKAMGFAFRKPCAPISAFDLIDSGGVTAVPARKGYYFIRVPGEEPVLVPEADSRIAAARGYGAAFSNPTLPDPRRAGGLIAGLALVEPVDLLPDYQLEPSISQPRIPYRVLPESPA